MPHHRRAQGQDPSSQHSSAAPVARRNLVAPDTAASHEDTSSDRSGAKFACAARQARLRFAKRGPCGPSLYASVTSQLSLSSPFNQHPTAGHPAAVSRNLLRTSSSLSALPRAPASWRYADRRSFASPRGLRNAGRAAQRCFAGGGGERIRTDDLLLAKQALSQLSYTPVAEDNNQCSVIRISAH